MDVGPLWVKNHTPIDRSGGEVSSKFTVCDRMRVMTLQSQSLGDIEADDGTDAADALTIGRRIRQLRTARGMTLDALAAAVERAPSQLSMIETGKREPKLTLLRAIAKALGASVDQLLEAETLDERATLEISLERAMKGQTFRALGIAPFRIGKSVPDEALRAMLALQGEIERLGDERSATPEEARRANVELRHLMRRQDNYFGGLEEQARGILRAVDHPGGPLTQRTASDIAAHLGFSLHYVADLPASTRSVADIKNGRLYLSSTVPAKGDSRTAVLQALASRILGHSEPHSYAEFLRQRVETNYLTGALMHWLSGCTHMPEPRSIARSGVGACRHNVSRDRSSPCTSAGGPVRPRPCAPACRFHENSGKHCSKAAQDS